MKHVYITHAVRRRISQHLLMQRARLHDVLCTLWRHPQRLCELTLWRYRRTSSNLAIVLILPNTQRSEKVKRRKGNKGKHCRRRGLCAERTSVVLTRGCADVINSNPRTTSGTPCACLIIPERPNRTTLVPRGFAIITFGNSMPFSRDVSDRIFFNQKKVFKKTEAISQNVPGY